MKLSLSHYSSVGYGQIVGILNSIDLTDQSALSNQTYLEIIPDKATYSNEFTLQLKWCYFEYYRTNQIFNLYTNQLLTVSDITIPPTDPQLSAIIISSREHFKIKLAKKQHQIPIIQPIKDLSDADLIRIRQQLYHLLLDLPTF